MRFISNWIINLGISKSVLTGSVIIIVVAGWRQGKLPNYLGCFITEVLFALGTGLFSGAVVVCLYKIYDDKVKCEMTEKFYSSIWGASNQIIGVFAKLGIDTDKTEEVSEEVGPFFNEEYNARIQKLRIYEKVNMYQSRIEFILAEQEKFADKLRNAYLIYYKYLDTELVKIICDILDANSSLAIKNVISFQHLVGCDDSKFIDDRFGIYSGLKSYIQLVVKFANKYNVNHTCKLKVIWSKESEEKITQLAKELSEINNKPVDD